MKKFNFSVVFVLVLCGIHVQGQVDNFYKNSCPRAESIVRDIVWKKVAADPGLAADFLRMQFHDCFVRGCDGSLLLDTTNRNNPSEKEAIPNQTLEGFEVIDEVKAALEAACPDTVSCADILALVARDAVSFQRKRLLWDVETGRRDGSISRASEANNELPSPFDNFNTLRTAFANKGLDVKDLVVLSGAHTIGIAHCNTFSDRLYNFTGKGDADPSLDPKYANFLRTKCKSLADTTTSVELDFEDSLVFNPHYYKILKQRRGLLQSDAALLTNGVSSNIVDQLLDPAFFYAEFRRAIRKMGRLGVKTGNAGEIRKVCTKVNSRLVWSE